MSSKKRIMILMKHLSGMYRHNCISHEVFLKLHKMIQESLSTGNFSSLHNYFCEIYAELPDPYGDACKFIQTITYDGGKEKTYE